MLRSEKMATTTHIPLSDYLRTNYRPDREYVDGEVRERNVGKWEHARLMALFATWFGKYESEWGIVGSTAQRVQVSHNRVREPDLVVLKAGPQPDVLTDPPLLDIEILSPDDSYSETQERAQDYHNMGVATVWIIDPKTRSGRMCSGLDWTEGRRLAVSGTPVYVELDEIFSPINTAKS
jgi:Uma2 family endonuclease